MKARYLVQSALLATALALLGCQVSPMSILAQDGGLRITVQGAERTVQARLADIDHLIVGIQTPFTTATQSISGQAVHNGSASATFQSLKPGVATLSVEAYSATGSIGVATASTTIEALKIKHVSVELTLAPNYDYRGNVDLGISVGQGPDVVVTPTPEPHD